jgi:hypothetical protein
MKRVGGVTGAGCSVELGVAVPWQAKPGRCWKAAAAPWFGAGGGRRPDGPKGRVGQRGCSADWAESHWAGGKGIRKSILIDFQG